MSENLWYFCQMKLRSHGEFIFVNNEIKTWRKVRLAELCDNKRIQFAVTLGLSMKSVSHEVFFRLLSVKCRVRKFIKLSWINLLTVKSGLLNIHDFANNSGKW